ncbi:HinT-interacting membrane complex protein P80 [Mycoplasma nasistruthionis]|uniref:Membrane protein P80 n=1 Tax=Mycoplasma nasistruthionis TaxID=353852 RepID=A0A4Y6I755_9MOLU|nr:hypothetical protein [Mycoplasma nasistruthionis]QDF65150.1 hypothetical protein FIV53_02530 [Mycoplasma nasistruthionis]
MAKRQKSFFERLTELNDRHDERKNKNTTNKQKRSKLSIILFSILTVGIIAAITIPLTVTVTKVSYNQPVEGDKPVFSFKKPSGDSSNVLTVSELTNKIDTDASKTNAQMSDLYHKAISYLYQQEYEASIQYQNIINGSRTNSEQVQNNIQLKSLDDIKKDVKNQIEDLKSNLKKVYGFENWNKQFTAELQKEEYGKSATEQQAIDFLVFKQIETEAKRRFELEFKLTDRAFIDRTATKTIYKVDALGQQVRGENGQPIVLFNQGDKVFPYLKENVNYFVDPNNSNKIVTLLTKSFITEKTGGMGLKSPEPFINELAKKQLVIPTIMQLPGVASKDLNSAFTVDSNQLQTLKNLFMFNVYKNTDSSASASFTLSSNFDTLKSFKTAPNYALKQDGETDQQFAERLARHQVLLGKLTLSGSQNLATSGLVEVKDLFSSNQYAALSLIASEVFTKDNKSSIPEVDLTKMFSKDNLTAEIAGSDAYKTAVEAFEALKSANKTLDQTALELASINKQIEDFFNGLSETNKQNVLKAIYNKNLVQKVNSSNKMSFTYKIKDMEDAYLTVSDKEINIVRFDKINSIEDIKKYIKLDGQSLASTNKTNFNVANKLNKSLSQNEIIQKTLKLEGFNSYLQEQTNEVSENKDKYSTELINSLSTKIDSIVEGNSLKTKVDILTSISSWIQNQLKTETSNNFTISNGLNKIVYDWQNQSFSEKSAIDTLSEAVSKVIQDKTEGGNN